MDAECKLVFSLNGLLGASSMLSPGSTAEILVAWQLAGEPYARNNDLFWLLVVLPAFFAALELFFLRCFEGFQSSRSTAFAWYRQELNLTITVLPFSTSLRLPIVCFTFKWFVSPLSFDSSHSMQISFLFRTTRLHSKQ